MSTTVTVILLVLLIAALVWFAIDIGKHLDAHSREIAALHATGGFSGVRTVCKCGEPLWPQIMGEVIPSTEGSRR